MDLSKINLDPIFNSRVRLSIISILSKNDKYSFTDIVIKTKASSGNISVQLKKLEAAGYIEVQKEFRYNYPNTVCQITETGTKAFRQYRKAINEIINIGNM